MFKVYFTDGQIIAVGEGTGITALESAAAYAAGVKGCSIGEVVRVDKVISDV